MKRLITDRDLLTGAVTGPIVLDAQTLITPSARDRAAKLGLEIQEAGVGGWHAVPPKSVTPCAHCGAASCLCAATAGGCSAAPLPASGQHAATLGALADGLYLVRVQGGRVSVLPATGPGLMARREA
jgi:hypothetical protein